MKDKNVIFFFLKKNLWKNKKNKKSKKDIIKN